LVFWIITQKINEISKNSLNKVPSWANYLSLEGFYEKIGTIVILKYPKK